MAASLGPGSIRRKSAKAQRATYVSVALINIPLGNYCLVRQHGNASNFFRASSNFFREEFRVFSRSDHSRNAKKHEIHCKTRRMREANRVQGAMRELFTKAPG